MNEQTVSRLAIILLALVMAVFGIYHFVYPQNLVSYVHAGSDRLANRHRPRVLPGAIANVGEDMLVLDKVCGARPVGTLTAQLRVAYDMAVHQIR